jgi:hypothetical protein
MSRSLSLPWELNDVPHGEIHHHFYKSTVAEDGWRAFQLIPFPIVILHKHMSFVMAIVLEDDVND